ncbi:indoleamine 2,3-dioxygenase [Halobacteriales archaeon QS_1_68_20]|nr:MAG: indoleamine 2,3-dioxygenase [Halobacteriales archaeon QS_1_68_20]
MTDRDEPLDPGRFGVSPERGFLPDEAPPTSFEGDDPFLARLDELGRDLPALLERGDLAAAVRDLDPPSADRYDDLTDRELERVYGVTGFLANAYVNGAGGNVVPEGVAVPLYESTRRLDRTPVLSYDAYVLHNWTRADHGRGFAPHDVRTITNFVEARDEQWFVAVHVAIEATAGPALAAIGDAQAGILDDDPRQVETALRTMEDSLYDLIGVLDRMPEHNHPETYGRGFRPYLMALTDVAFEGVPEMEGRHSFRGASGAQSSVFPALDAAIGVDQGDNPLVTHLRELRADMPTEHKAFVEAAAAGPDLHDYVAETDDDRLREAFNEVVDRMVRFRKLHVEVVRRYLTEPFGERKGTGGTPHGPFLEMFIDNTEAMRIEG